MSKNAVNIRLIQNFPTPAPETSPPITSHSEESQSTLILAITVSTSLSSQAPASGQWQQDTAGTRNSMQAQLLSVRRSCGGRSIERSD